MGKSTEEIRAELGARLAKDFLSLNEYAKHIGLSDTPKTDEAKALCNFGHHIHKKAQELFPNGFEDKRKMSFSAHVANSMELLKSKKVPLFELGILYDNLYARPDIMVPNGNDSWTLIEVKTKKKFIDEDIKYTAFMFYICKNIGMNVSNVKIMHLARYVKDNTPLEDIFQTTDITKECIKLESEIVDDINDIRNKKKDRLKQKYKDDELKAKKSLDFQDLAENIAQNFNDLKWSKKLYKKAVSLVEQEKEYSTYFKYVDIAQSIINHLNDKEWGKELFAKAIGLYNRTCDSLTEAAAGIMKTLNDKKWAIELCQKEESDSTECREYSQLACDVIEILNDKEWGESLYKKALDAESNSHGCYISQDCEIAENIISNLNDKKWATEIYKYAIKKASRCYNFYDIAESVIKHLGDKYWGKDLLEKAVELYDSEFDTYQQLIQIADCASELLEDKDFAKQVYNKASDELNVHIENKL